MSPLILAARRLPAVALLTAAAGAQHTAFVAAPDAVGGVFQHIVGLGTSGVGGGAAWFDHDLDGDEDLFALSSNGSHALFRNDGSKLVDVAAGAGLHGLTGAPAFLGVIAADHDQDGLTDLYLTSIGPNALLRNIGDGSFRDRAAAVGVAGTSFSTSAAWADFDLDGDLDLYVGNYLGSMSFPYHVGQANALYLSDGAPAPVYKDRARMLGVDGTGIFGPTVPGFPFVSPQGEPTAGLTLSACTLDLDEDGDPDLLVGNDFGEWVLSDRYYRNDVVRGGPLAFTDVSDETGFGHHGHYNMGVNGADFDHDGDWDLYLSNLGDNKLLRDEGGVYAEVAHEAGPVEGLDEEGVYLLSSWGTVWADFDLDMWEDLFVVNGFIPAAWFIENALISPNHLWMNAGDGTFERMDPASSGLANTGVGRGVAAADVDRDGWLDLWVLNNGAFDAAGAGPEDALSRLFLNRLGLVYPERHFIELWLHGWKSNLEGLGARVLVEVGGHTLRRQVVGDPVYLSSSSRVVHAGLGEHGVVPRVTIDWPSGLHQELVELRADRLLHLGEPRVTIEATPAPWLSGDRLHLPLVLRNHRDATVEVGGSAVVRSAETGTVIAEAPAWTMLAPGEVAALELLVPLGELSLPAALEMVARIECEEALDMRLVPFSFD